MTIAAVLFLAAFAIPILAPHVGRPVVHACRAVTWITWVLFVADFVVRFGLADRRRRFLLTHLVDVAIIVLPFLRPLRLLRLVTLLEVLNKRASTGLRGQVAVYVAAGSSLLAFCGALAVLDAERHDPKANIHNFGNAIWWAITTMTTVGYGDYYPVTTKGRVIASALMVAGVALLGVVTATVASWLVERVSDVQQAESDDLRKEIADLRLDVRQLLAQRTDGRGTDSRARPDECVRSAPELSKLD